jgi:tRNA A-37 threonylcarbamoyl transferase component Bud32
MGAPPCMTDSQFRDRLDAMLDVRVGSYRITEHLAKGGMGEVYLARHDIMEREAAVKLLHVELSDKRHLVDRFLNEARAAASIRHPGIVEVFDVGHVDGRAYIVMEYLRGELLASRLARTRIDVDKVLLLTRQIAGALGAAHACGIIHRDLKPDNIFIVPDPDVVGGERTKILDFGIAKLLESQSVVHTAKGALFGTPTYMAPEQCQDAAQVDRRADLYSLGCIVYELLAGTPPFGRGGMELIAAHLRDQPPPLRDRAPHVSAALESIVMGLLAKDPDERFQTCEALIRALDHVQAEKLTTPPLLARTDAPDAAPPLPAGALPHAVTVRPHGAMAAGSPTSAVGSAAAGAGPESLSMTAADAHAGATPLAITAALSAVSIPEPPARVAGDMSENGRAAVRSRSRWAGLAALVVLVASAGGFWLWRGSLAAVPVPVAADAGPDARVVLEQARRALADRAWEDVHVLVREALALASEDPALRAEGDAMRARAREEHTNLSAFLLFERALAKRDMQLAAKHHRELSARSVYRADAAKLLDGVRAEWLASQVSRAQEYAGNEQCRRIERIEAEVLEVADVLGVDVAPILEVQEKCLEQRRQEEERQTPEEHASALPARVEQRLQRQIQRCARQHGVHGDVVVRVQMSAQALVQSLAIEPAGAAFVACVRARIPRRLGLSPGTYRATAKIP